MPRPVLAAVVHARAVDSVDAVRATTSGAAGIADVVVVAGATGHLGGLADDVRLVEVPGVDDDAGALRRKVEPELDAAWALWLDPSDEVVGSGLATRCVLALAAAPALRVTVSAATPWPEALGRLRLARTGAGRWTGRVHPRLVDGVGRPLGVAELPAAALTLRQPDPTPEMLARRVELAARDVALGDPGAVLTLAHAQLLAGAAGAASTLTTAAERGGPDAACALDLLARTALAEGRDADAETYATRLDGRYRDWLVARAAVQLGRAAEAWNLVKDLDDVAGPDGFPVPGGVLDEMRSLIAFTAGHPADAVRLLESAMGMHGQIEGRGALLQAFCSEGGVPFNRDAVLARALPEYVAALGRELPAVEVAA